MGYPELLKVANRKLTDNVLIASAPFTMANNSVNFGARMALIEYDGKILVWSALPYGSEVVKSLEALTGKSEPYNVSHLIVPNTGHTMAAASFKEKYPDIKVFGSEHINVPGLKIDYPFNESQGNRIIGAEELKKEFGITDPFISDNFEFVYLPNNKSKELAVFDKTSKILFAADLLMNLGAPGTTTGEVTLEQFSPETGYPKGFNPHGGFSFLTRYVQPQSKIGSYLMGKLSGEAASGTGMKLIHSWNFNTVVLAHGNIIDKDARDVFQSVFGKFWQGTQ